MTQPRKILSLILSAIIVLSFAACGSSSSTTQQQNSQTTTKAAEQKNLTWATWAISEEALKPTYMSMITTFMDKNPDVKIEAISYPYAQYKDQLIISATAGNAPDIAHIKSEWMPELKNLGALQDLTNVMSDELKADYFPAILAGATEDGKINAARSLPTGNAYFMQADEALADALAMLTISKDPVEKIVADLDAKVKELYKK